MAKRPFGVSTRLYRARRLSRDHLLEIAAAGFETVELFAARGHFDYENPSVTADLQQWLAEAGLSLHGIHAPAGEDQGSRGTPTLSLASADAETRARAVIEAGHALHIARRIPAKVLVVHVGLLRAQTRAAAPDGRAGARRSLEELCRMAEPLGVRVAVEVIQNELSRAASLVHLIEKDLEGSGVGICLDFGHAHLAGDVPDAIETVSEHLATTHVHDNHGRTDEHLVPFEGSIDWAAALTTVQKVGYDGAFVMELSPRGPSKEMLAKAQRARHGLERLLAQ